MNKKIFIIISALFLVFLSVFIYVQQASANVTKVTVSKTVYPGYYWCQHTNGTWSTYSDIDGKVVAKNAGGEPAKTWVTTTANISTPTTDWRTVDGSPVTDFSKIKNIKIVNVSMAESADSNIQGQPSISSDKKKVIIKGYSGKGIEGSNTPNVCGGNPSMIYPFPVTVTWEGEIDKPTITLEMEPKEYIFDPGQKGEFKVYAKWSHIPNQRFEVDDSRLQWSSASPSFVSVDANGWATGILPTENAVKITAYMPEYNVSAVGYVYVRKNLNDVPPPIPEEPPEEPPEELDPPTVHLYGPKEVKMGDTFCLSASAYSPNGKIEEWYWSYTGEGTVSNNGNCDLYYMEEGPKNVTVTVIDEKGLSASDDITINVLPPTPVPSFTIGGTLKENRKVTITNTSKSPTKFPIVLKDSYFIIRPTNHEQLEPIKFTGMKEEHKQNGYYKIPLNDLLTINALFKKLGSYEIDLYVVNTAGYSALYSDPTNPESKGRVEKIQIVEDEKPVADFSVVEYMYRDPKNQLLARIFPTNRSYSKDHDFIKRVIYTVIYDSNNDNSFDDDEKMIFDSDKMKPGVQESYHHSNGMTVYVTMNEEFDLEFLTPRIGKYKIIQEVIESFGQPTIEEFITENDYKRDKTE